MASLLFKLSTIIVKPKLLDKMKCHKLCVIIIGILSLSLLISFSIDAHDLLLKERLLSVEDGLSDRNIHNFLECSRGYMWIATSNGLNRFDGRNFKVYKSPLFPSSSILKLAEDWQGNLWLGHAKHIFGFVFKQQNHNAIGVFDPIAENYQQLNNYLPDLPVPVDSIISIEQFFPKQIHFSTSNGKLYRYDSLGIHLVYEHPSSFDIYLNPVPLGNGNFMGFDGYKYFSLNQTNDVGYTKEDSITTSEWQCMRACKLSLDSLKKKKYLRAILKDYNFTNYYPNEKVALLQGWIKNEEKFVHLFYSFENDEIINLPYPDNKSQIGDCLYINKQNQVWNIKRPGIIHISELNSYPFQTISNDLPTRGICELTNKAILVSENYTLAKYDINGFPIFNIHDEIECWAVYNDEQNIWFSTTHDIEGKLFQYNLSTHEKVEIPTANNIGTGIYWSIYRDKMKRLWVGHENGISYLNPKKKYLEIYQPQGNFQKLNESTVYHFYENHEGLWLATSNGIFLLDRNGYKVIKHWHSNASKQEEKLPFDHILHIYEDRFGIFWLASRGGGLIEWQPQKNKYTQYTTKQGFPHNTLYEVYEDDFGFLWMGSDNGLIRFNKKNHHIEVFTEEDGIAHNEFNTISHFRGQDGTLYFGGLKGVTKFHPKDFIQNSIHIPQLHLTNLKKQDEEGEFHDILSSTLKNNQLTLDPTDLGIQVQFALMEFLEPKRIVYAYKLQGTDNEWVTLDKPSFRINKLDYGKYNLLLRAKTVEGIWTPPLKLPIHVLKPFYLNWYFISCLALSLIGLSIGISYIRSRAFLKAQESLKRTERDKAIIEKQAAQLQKIDEVKSRFFSNISHELRTPLTLISSPTRQLLYSIDHVSKEAIAKQLQVIVHNADILKHLVDDILDLSKLTDDRMELHETAMNLNEFIQLVFSNFDSLAKHLNINYALVNELPNHCYVKVDYSKVEKVLNNLLSNALKFTAAEGKVTLQIWLTQDILHVKVADTGKGIPANILPHLFDRFYQAQHNHQSFQGSTGIGLALAKEMTHFMKGNLQVESLVGHGSQFTLSIPIKTADQHEVTNDFARFAPPLIFDQSITKTIATNNVKSSAPNDKLNGTILIVEDHKDLQAFLTKLLAPNYQILNAYNGIEALSILNATPVQLIISDIMMPEMDGFTFIEKLRTENKWRAIPVIMLTALGNNEHKLKVLSLGVDDYLIKPFAPEELYARVNNLIARYHEKQNWNSSEKNDKKTASDKSTTTNLVSEDELKWVEEVKKTILTELANKYFLLEDVADSVNLSMRQFRRKIKKITGMSPSELHREVALQEARRLLENKNYSTVKAVAQSVGFAQNTARFSQYYFDRFGKKPISYFK